MFGNTGILVRLIVPLNFPSSPVYPRAAFPAHRLNYPVRIFHWPDINALYAVARKPFVTSTAYTGIYSGLPSKFRGFVMGLFLDIFANQLLCDIPGHFIKSRFRKVFRIRILILLFAGAFPGSVFP